MDQKVRTATPPTWQQLAEFCAGRGYPLQLRMIDGQLAFPDEQPPEDWKELRAGTPAGMITLRREPDGIRLVTWGNADDAMRRAWNGLAWAVATLSEGIVESMTGTSTAAEFGLVAELPGEFNTGR